MNNNKIAHPQNEPDIIIDTKKVFGFEIDFEIKGFSERSDYVPEIDKLTFLTKKQLKLFLQVFQKIEELWFKGIMVPVNRLISNRLQQD